jgi:signal transduction histidine kinase
VLLNLLTNAAFAVRDRAEGRGSIVVRVRCDGHDARHVTLDVVDDGVGIRERERAMVGEVHFTTRPDVGRGFGLALCRSIVESYGGSFRLDPARPHGTRARVVLPVLHFEAAGEKRS